MDPPSLASQVVVPAADVRSPQPRVDPAQTATIPNGHVVYIGRDGQVHNTQLAQRRAAEAAAHRRQRKPTKWRRMIQQVAMTEAMQAQALYEGMDDAEVRRRARKFSTSHTSEDDAGGDEDSDAEVEQDDSAYAQFVTAALDQPDYVREEELGDYDTYEGYADGGGGRAAIEEEEEEAELQARDTMMQAQYLRHADEFVYREGGQRLRFCYNEALGEPAGTNEAGAALRKYDGIVYIVSKYIKPPQDTRKARMRHQLAQRIYRLPDPELVRRSADPLKVVEAAAQAASTRPPSPVSAADREAARATALANAQTIKGGGRHGGRFGRGSGGRK